MSWNTWAGDGRWPYQRTWKKTYQIQIDRAEVVPIYCPGEPKKKYPHCSFTWTNVTIATSKQEQHLCIYIYVSYINTKHSNETWTFWRCIFYWKRGQFPAMIDYHVWTIRWGWKQVLTPSIIGFLGSFPMIPSTQRMLKHAFPQRISKFHAGKLLAKFGK